ncbi:MAG: hypothetical protein ACUZ9M_00855 [Candidatus Scalindua sp.]
MRIYKTVEVKETADICCDKCGRSCIGELGNFCGISFEVSGGYDSPVCPDDETVTKYDICEYCATDWIKTFAKSSCTTNTS